MTNTVGIIGAGTMGAGIAQVAAQHGWDVALMDVDEAMVGAAFASIRKRFNRLVEKGRLDAAARDDAAARLHVAHVPVDFVGADLVIEAVVEDLDTKEHVLGTVVAAVAPETIIATNTSSLSVTAIGRSIDAAERTVGMHFFNPAPIMQLVEVIAGRDTAPEHVDRVAEIATEWGKKVAAADVPGFIVNHVARPYYLEAFRILEDGHAGVDVIDAAMTGIGGFRMGPFALTDLIGQDVNTATTRSVWRQLGEPPLLRPSRAQESLVEAGRLGRKSRRGAYDHHGVEPVPSLEPGIAPPAIPDDVARLANVFAERGAAAPGDPLGNYVFARILTALMIQARHALARGVATASDIDTALRYGTNYPAGPFEWRERIGAETCDALAAALDATVDDGRFAPPASAPAPTG